MSLAYDNPTISIDAESSLPAHFERVVAAHAMRTAIVGSGWQATYGELNAAANRLAHALLRGGGSPGDRIAILMAHDAPLIAATLAVLKAGRINVVLNPTDLSARLRQLLQDAQPSAIVTDTINRDLASQLAGPGCDVIVFDVAGSEGPTGNPGLILPGDATAFLTFTSGSTGQPKAVMKSHRMILDNAVRHDGPIGFTPDDRFGLFSSLSGGQGVSSTWSALAFGASLCPFAVIDRGFNGLADFIDRRRVTIYRSSASLFRQFMRTLSDDIRFPRVRVVHLASEPATSDDFNCFKKHFTPNCSFVLTLSSSETGIISHARRSWHDVVPPGILPVGTAAEGIRIVLVDDAGEPVGSGMVGEIAIGCSYLATGYWQKSGVLSERFSAGQDKLHRTGDLGRFNADGQLVYLGRKDRRVKLRGYRIDLSEIEGALLRLPAIDKAAVGTVDRAGNEPRLVAYIILRPGHAATAGAIRSSLRAALPRHMVPSAFFFFDEFPLTPHGKIDRARLQQAYSVQADLKTDDEPRTETEALLAKIWRETFDVSEIGRNDDFLDLGGDSLMAAVITAGIHDVFGVETEIALFFKHPVLADQARIIENLKARLAKRATAPKPRPSSATYPLSFGQRFYWDWSQSQRDSTIHTGLYQVRLVGPLDPDLLRRCIDLMTHRHESFRTSFRAVDGEPMQVVHASLSLAFEFHDLSGEAQPDVEAKALFMRRKNVSIDIRQPPLISFVLVRLRVNEHWLAGISHHIISDGWSWSIFFRELGRIYEAKLNDAQPDLAPPRGYGDFALWQKETFRPGHPIYDDHLMWWIDHVLAATYPNHLRYRRALLACIRFAPRLPPVVKKSIGRTLRGLFNVPRPPNSDLPFCRAEPASGLNPMEGILIESLSPETSQLLTEIGRKVGGSHFVVRVAAYAGLLAVKTGSERVVLGTYFSTRSRAVARDVIGFCANYAMLLLRYDRDQTFEQFVIAVRDHVREVQSHGEFPYEILHREMRSWGIKPPGMRSLASISTTQRDTDFAGIRISTIHEHFPPSMPSGFEMKFDRHGGSNDELRVRFDAHRYDAEAVRALLGSLVRLLDLVSREPDIPMAQALARV